MAVIEHRTAEGVLEAFASVDNTKFALWQGNTQCFVFEGDDKNEAIDKLTDWLSMLENSGTTAIYTLKVYSDSIHDITSKTAYKMATRFQLRGREDSSYQKTPDGNVLVVRDGGQRQISGTQIGGNNAQFTALLEGQNRLIEMMAQHLKTREADRMDKLIGFLEQGALPKEPTTWDKIAALGEMIISKPDIIDRIGYVIRPEIYQRVEQPINGTEAIAETKIEPEKKEAMVETAEAPLTEAEIETINNRLDESLDVIEAEIGLQRMEAVISKLASYGSDKLAKLTPEKLAMAMNFL